MYVGMYASRFHPAVLKIHISSICCSRLAAPLYSLSLSTSRALACFIVILIIIMLIFVFFFSSTNIIFLVRILFSFPFAFYNIIVGVYAGYYRCCCSYWCCCRRFKVLFVLCLFLYIHVCLLKSFHVLYFSSLRVRVRVGRYVDWFGSLRFRNSLIIGLKWLGWDWLESNWQLIKSDLIALDYTF